MDGKYPRRIPDVSDFYYAGVIVDFMEDQFDKHIVGNDPPGDGPAASSGDCNYNFISVKWAMNNGIIVETRSSVPVRYLADERHPAGPFGRSEDVLNIIGSTNLTISVPGHEPRTLTFLVFATNSEIEVFDPILNYHEFGLDANPFFFSPESLSPCGPKLLPCDLEPCGVLEHLEAIPLQNYSGVDPAPTPPRLVVRTQPVRTRMDTQ